MLWGIVATLVLLSAVALLYNRLIRLRTLANEAWSDVDVSLSRRADLIGNLTTIAKAYATHEKEFFVAVAEIRATILAADNRTQRIDAEENLDNIEKKLVMLAESYPELKANENFLQLTDQLVVTEDRIAGSRRIYNSNTSDYNSAISTFPGILMASVFHFHHIPFYNTTISTR